MDDKIAVVKYGLTESERVLTLEVFREFICDHSEDIFLPYNIVTPSELQGMSYV
jgi:hypothetical protein